MSSVITCPNCKNEFEPTAVMEQAIGEKFKAQYNAKWIAEKKKQEDEIRAREEVLAKSRLELEEARRRQDDDVKNKVAEEGDKLRKKIQKDLEESTAERFRAKMTHLEEQATRSQEQLRESQKKELEFLRLQASFTEQIAAQELEQQKAINLASEQIKAEAKKAEEERSRIKEEERSIRMKEYEKQLADQRLLIEEMKRKAEQGSMQLQGEAKEQVVEEILAELFPFDTISKSRKGVEETDLTQVVFNDFRHSCGKIVYEIKNTKAWNEKWLDKLKLDMRNGCAEMAVIISKALPKDCSGFSNKDGIWICNHDTIRIVAVLLRDTLIKVYEANKLLDNVSDKKERLYKYMTSTEFRQKWDAIIEVYATMQKQLAKEKISAQKSFGERAKQLDVMLANTVGFIGDIKGLGGLEMMDIKMLSESEEV